MNADARLESLERKHEKIHSDIERMISSPSARDEDISRMKKEKLALKDQISALREKH